MIIMSENLKKSWPYLKVIASLNDGTSRKILLKEFSKDIRFRKALREIAKNTLRKKIPLSTNQIKFLKTHKTTLTRLTKKRNSLIQSRKLAVQSGGFLPLLIPLIANIIGEVIKSKN